MREVSTLRHGVVAQSKVWIDMDNTPHVPFFTPIIRQLRARGCLVILTVRDAYQTRQLADLFNLDYHRVGKHYGKHRLLKIAGTCIRSAQLVGFIRRIQPHLAIAHSSRSLTIAAAVLRVPSLQIIDYEFIASAGVARPTWLMVPEIIPSSRLNAERVLTYPGLKEDVYVSTFVPDSSLPAQLQLTDKDLVVTVRPPATEAHYHNPESDKLFETVMDLLGITASAKIVVLPRNARQEEFVRSRWHQLLCAGKVIIPANALDGLNLIWHSDLVVSGGGTMNREAAALGVPVYSIFRGEIGAVDRYLANSQRLVLLESSEDVRAKLVLQKRVRSSRPAVTETGALRTIVDHITKILECCVD